VKNDPRTTALNALREATGSERASDNTLFDQNALLKRPSIRVAENTLLKTLLKASGPERVPQIASPNPLATQDDRSVPYALL